MFNCIRWILAGLLVGLLSAFAQEGRPDFVSPPTTGRNLKPPVSKLESVLDVNGDGTIDANEIVNSPVSLKKLDTNGDSQLTADELRPSPPPRVQRDN